MNEPTPRKTHLQPKQGESIWEAAARELAGNPDSPASLKIMSAVGNALRPRAQAVEQVVAALASEMVHAGPRERAAVQAAIQYWHRVSGEPIGEEHLQELKKAAKQRIEQPRRRPPAMEDILTSAPATMDTGYQLGVHLEGIQGTWHRLWALIVITLDFESDIDSDSNVAVVRAQFESLLGRPMSTPEWCALVEQARRTDPPNK